MTLDAAGRIVAVDPGLARRLGIAAAAFLGRPLAALGEILPDGPCRLPAPAGELHGCTASTLLPCGGRVVIVVEDAGRAALMQRAIKAEDANRAKTRMLAVVGHEGSTVLVSLNGLRLLGYRE